MGYSLTTRIILKTTRGMYFFNDPDGMHDRPRQTGGASTPDPVQSLCRDRLRCPVGFRLPAGQKPACLAKSTATRNFIGLRY